MHPAKHKVLSLLCRCYLYSSSLDTDTFTVCYTSADHNSQYFTDYIYDHKVCMLFKITYIIICNFATTLLQMSTGNMLYCCGR